MNEQFVAIGGPSPYPESRGKVMPGESHEELAAAREPTNQEERAKSVPPEGKKIPFADAASIAEIAERVKKKAGAVVLPDQINRFKGIIQEFGGYDDEAISGMGNEDVIAAAHEVLKTVPVDKAKVGDIKIADRAGREAEEARLLDLIEAVKTSEAGFATEELEKYVRVEEFDYGEAKGGGPGAMDVEGLPDEAGVADEVKPYGFTSSATPASSGSPSTSIAPGPPPFASP